MDKNRRGRKMPSQERVPIQEHFFTSSQHPAALLQVNAPVLAAEVSTCCLLYFMRMGDNGARETRGFAVSSPSEQIPAAAALSAH